MPSFITRIATGDVYVDSSFKVVSVRLAQPRRYYDPPATMEQDAKPRRRIFRLFSRRHKKSMTVDSNDIQEMGAEHQAVDDEHPATYTPKVALQPPGHVASSRDSESTPVRPERRRKKTAPPPPAITVDTRVEEVPKEKPRHSRIQEYDVVCEGIVVDQEELPPPPVLKDIGDEATVKHGRPPSTDGEATKVETGDDMQHVAHDDDVNVHSVRDVAKAESLICHEYDVVVADDVSETLHVPAADVPSDVDAALELGTVALDVEDAHVTVHAEDEHAQVEARPADDGWMAVGEGMTDECASPPPSHLSDDEYDILSHFRDAIADGERQLLDMDDGATAASTLPAASTTTNTADELDRRELSGHPPDDDEAVLPTTLEQLLPDPDGMSSVVVAEFEELQCMFEEWRRESAEYDAIVKLGARVPDHRRAHLLRLQKEIARQHDKVQDMCKQHARAAADSSPATSDSGLSGTHESSYSAVHAPPSDKHLFVTEHVIERLEMRADHSVTPTTMTTIAPKTPVTFDNYNGRGGADAAAIYARQPRWADVVEGPDTTETVVKPSDLFGRRRHNYAPVVDVKPSPPATAAFGTKSINGIDRPKKEISPTTNTTRMSSDSRAPTAQPHYVSRMATLPSTPVVNRFTTEYHRVAEDSPPVSKAPAYDRPSNTRAHEAPRQPANARRDWPTPKPVKHFTSDYSLNTNTKNVPSTTERAKVFTPAFSSHAAPSHRRATGLSMESKESLVPSNVPPPPPLLIVQTPKSALFTSHTPKALQMTTARSPLSTTSQPPKAPPLNITPNQLVEQMSQVRLKSATSARRPHPAAESRKLPENGRDVLMDAIRRHGGLKKVVH